MKDHLGVSNLRWTLIEVIIGYYKMFVQCGTKEGINHFKSNPQLNTIYMNSITFHMTFLSIHVMERIVYWLGVI